MEAYASKDMTALVRAFLDDNLDTHPPSSCSQQDNLMKNVSRTSTIIPNRGRVAVSNLTSC